MKKIEKIMELLGCKQIEPGIFRHPNKNYVNIKIDLSATHEDCVLLALAQIFSEIGYESCQQHIREALGL